MISTMQRDKLMLATVKQYAVNFLVDEGFAESGIEAHEQFQLESAMRAIRISFKYPAQVLQKDHEIARYPRTLWDHLLHSIGLGRYARYARVLLNEHLAFPGVELSPERLRVGNTYVCYDYAITDITGDFA